MTLLFHIDESADTEHEFFIGLLVDGADAANATERLDEIVSKASADGACRTNAELHGVELFHQNSDWESASIEQAKQVVRDCIALLEEFSIEVIARGVRLRPFKEKYPGTDPYRWEFSNLLERLNERLQVRGEYGLVIADQQHQHREYLQHAVVEARKVGTGGYRNQRLVRILDTAHFVDSKLSRMTQLADIIAFFTRRRSTIPTENDNRLEAFMAEVWKPVYNAIPDHQGQFFTIR